MNRSRNLIVLAVVAALIGGVVGFTSVFLGSSDDVAEASGLYIAEVDAIGPDSFSRSFATGQLPSDYEFRLTSGNVAASDSDLYIRPRGTYGGPGGNVCDIEGMKAFFAANPDRAAEWARIQDIGFAEIGSFLDTLTPVFLAQNVKLTMFGYRNGQAYGYEAVLEAGTAVLIDDEGMPRARCACGNPLIADRETPPEETTTTQPDTTTSTVPVTTEECPPYGREREVDPLDDFPDEYPYDECNPCPPGTTFVYTEDGFPETPDIPDDFEYVEISPASVGDEIDPSLLDEPIENEIDPWYPTTDLCAPPCPEAEPTQGDAFGDWVYDDEKWVNRHGDGESVISDTRLLPNWYDYCSPCPQGDITPDDAPRVIEVDGIVLRWDIDLGSWVYADSGEVVDDGFAEYLDREFSLSVPGLDPETERSLEDGLGEGYDPCAPVTCPVEQYLSHMPTVYADPAGWVWLYDESTQLWTPSNGAEPQAEVPATVRDRVDAYVNAYDPAGDCVGYLACPPAAGSPFVRHVTDGDGEFWTWSNGQWWSTDGETRTQIAEFPGCSPCQADTPSGEIFSFYDSSNVMWIGRADGTWFSLANDVEYPNVWSIPGYADNCGNPICPPGPVANGSLYLDPDGNAWAFIGGVWLRGDGINFVQDPNQLPGCDPNEAASAEAPVTAVISCASNTNALSHQMRVQVTGLTSKIVGVSDSLAVGAPYTRVGNLYTRNLDLRPSGIVSVRIETSVSAPIVYEHDVADCAQPMPRNEDFGIDIFPTCGFNSATRLWEWRLRMVDRGTPLSEIRTVYMRTDADSPFIRGGDIFTKSFAQKPLMTAYVIVELFDGALNEYLLATDSCDDVLTPGWSRLSAVTECGATAPAGTPTLRIELTGAVSEVASVWSPEAPAGPGQYWTYAGDNIWEQRLESLPSWLDDGRTIVAVRMLDGFVYSFDLEANRTIGCGALINRIEPFAAFGFVIDVACATGSSGEFGVFVNARPNNAWDLGVADVTKVSDTADPLRRYENLGGSVWTARWPAPPAAGDIVHFRVDLIDGRFDEVRLVMGDCNQLDPSVLANTLGESEEPIQFETTTTTIPSVATTTTTTLPQIVRPDTTTTTTTTLANAAPTIETLEGCNVSNERYRVLVSVEDLDGDRLTISASARSTNGADTPIPVTLSTRTVDASGTVEIDLQFANTNARVDVRVTDPRGGSDSGSIEVGSDFTFQSCPLG